MAAEKIANVSYWYVGGQSMKIALPMFMLPFLFVYNPVLLQFPKLSWTLAAYFALVSLMQWCLAGAQFGHMFRVLGTGERVVLFVLGAAGFVAMLQSDWLILAATGAAEVAAGIYFYWSARYAHPARRRQAATQ